MSEKFSELSTMELVQKKVRTNFKRIGLNIIFFVVIPGSLLYLAFQRVKEVRIEYVQEQQVTCPSLLSIARSARDTLIVMRDKSMCTEYMLKNLK